MNNEIEILPIKRADVSAQFAELTTPLAELIANAQAITVTDRGQIAEMKQAREIRLSLKAVRVAIEKKRKELGEDALRQKQAIDALAKDLKEKIEPLEYMLEQQEKFAELMDAKERAERLANRLEIMAVYSEFVSIGEEVADMSQDAFEMLVDGSKAKQQAAIAERERIEAERIAKEKAEAEDRERIRIENERLKKEAFEREAAIKAEREEAEKARIEAEIKANEERAKIEAKAKSEREAKEKAEREAAEMIAAQRRKEAEEKTERERIEAERIEAARKAASAPDKEKAMTFAATVRAMSAPQAATDDGERVMSEINAKIAGFANWIEKQAETL